MGVRLTGHLRDGAPHSCKHRLCRRPRFVGRTLFASLVIAPMVMPEVVRGISMLLLFVGSDQLLGGPERGFLTITIGHVTFSLAFVSLVVQARLADFDHTLEEAAMDLGATPWTTFLTVTLPLLTPALASGWLLAFTLSQLFKLHAGGEHLTLEQYNEIGGMSGCVTRVLRQAQKSAGSAGSTAPREIPASAT